MWGSLSWTARPASRIAGANALATDDLRKSLTLRTTQTLIQQTAEQNKPRHGNPPNELRHLL
jgi:hypothetical protein